MSPLEQIEKALAEIEAKTAGSPWELSRLLRASSDNILIDRVRASNRRLVAALRVVLKAGNGTFAQFYSEEIAKALTGEASAALEKKCPV